jgi:Xaa-Pro aminopeptidase
MNTREKITALRELLKKSKLDGFIIPRADEFQGEFVAPSSERLKWLTGFTGSAGAAVVLADKAAVLSDGRYTIQMKQQLDAALYEGADSVKLGVGGWLAEKAGEGAKIGFDPLLHTQDQIKKIQAALEGTTITLMAVPQNFIDAVWSDQPQKPLGRAIVFPEAVAGKSVKEKIETVAAKIKEQGGFAAVLAVPDSVCWLLNVRGSDVHHLPVVLSRAVVYADGRPVQWIVETAKIGADVQDHLGGQVSIHAPEEIVDILASLAKEAQGAGKPVLLDSLHAPIWIAAQIEKIGATVQDARDPCLDLKALKTPSEQDAIRRAHIEDGAALVKFLHWLELAADVANITELDVEHRLLEFRKQSRQFREDSFSTIAGFGANGAIVHYRATKETNLQLTQGNLLLLDSGGQYHWGTTDITRTIAIGTPTPEMCARFTQVLKGHIAVASASFPKGTTGAQIDALARAPLQEAGIRLRARHGPRRGLLSFGA